jgi:hypothetical protein
MPNAGYEAAGTTTPLVGPEPKKRQLEQPKCPSGVGPLTIPIQEAVTNATAPTTIPFTSVSEPPVSPSSTTTSSPTTLATISTPLTGNSNHTLLVATTSIPYPTSTSLAAISTSTATTVSPSMSHQTDPTDFIVFVGVIEWSNRGDRGRGPRGSDHYHHHCLLPNL